MYTFNIMSWVEILQGISTLTVVTVITVLHTFNTNIEYGSNCWSVYNIRITVVYTCPC